MRARPLVAGAAASGLLAAVAATIRFGTLVIDVRGASMRPTYEAGDRVLALRPALDRSPRTGDVVIVRAPAAGWTPDAGFEAATIVLVKRVARPPGSDGSVYVLGDAAGGTPGAHDSYDSRAFGALPRSAILGRVVARLPSARVLS